LILVHAERRRWNNHQFVHQTGGEVGAGSGDEIIGIFIGHEFLFVLP